MSFVCSSTSVSEFVLEFQDPIKSFPIQVTPGTITYYGKLIDMIGVDYVDGWREICFVLNPTSNNELQGRLEISELQLLKNVKSIKGDKRDIKNY